MVEGIIDVVQKTHCWVNAGPNQGAESGMRKRLLTKQLKLKNPRAAELEPVADPVPGLGSAATAAEVSAVQTRKRKAEAEQAGWDSLGADLFASDVDE